MADSPGYQGRWSVVPWDKIAKHIQIPVAEYRVEHVSDNGFKRRETVLNLDPEPWLIYINHRATAYRSTGWYESQPSDPIDINTVFSPRSVYSQKRDDYS